MRYRKTIITILIAFMSLLVVDNCKAGTNYPQIDIAINSGGSYNMSWEAWSSAMDVIMDNYPDADWHNNSEHDYILFDKNIDGVNRYGADFIKEMKDIESIDLIDDDNFTLWKNAIKGIVLNIENLDSDGDGYTNIEELNVGSLPGFSDNTPEDVESDNSDMEFAIIGILIVSVVILYFVFNRT